MIECCGKKQRARAFICDPPEGFIYQRIDFLVWCKKCKKTVMQVTRISVKNRVVRFRRTDDAARTLFERMRPSIRFRVVEPFSLVNNRSEFFLYYNEFGKKKKCFSNLSALKIPPDSLSLPQSRCLGRSATVR